MCYFQSSSNSPVGEEGKTGHRRLSYAVEPVAAFPATPPTSPRRSSTLSEPHPLPPACDCKSSEPHSSSDAVHAIPLCPSSSRFQIYNQQIVDRPSPIRAPTPSTRAPSNSRFQICNRRIADRPSPPPHSGAVHATPRDRR
ncbi:hypothetical protein TIFTF001_013407 [Ficus carica]|uniref:Uncharacterized protein n=1 Tax=Ficus carica TaxID=3494 RepID=A0AA88AHT3_FICCA|nr:hypothetical protein TIFTF001_013407 [Ficus carica]